MSAFKLILLAGCIISSLASYSQTQEQNTNTNPPNETNRVSKGYYSIHRNHQKLNPTKTIRPTRRGDTDASATSATMPVRKGYYSIGSNKGRQGSEGISLYEDGIQQGAIQISRPVVTKGYYSIGNNSRKLRN